jgi:hypothetical protein
VRRARRARLGRLLLLALLSLAVAAAVLYVKAAWVVTGGEGYVFGYPLVIMDVTRANAALTIGPENRLRRVREFPGPGFRDVVRPNVDTLYTTAFVDTARGPWVFEMPPNDQRYELMQFMDAWTNVFAAPGTRTAGTAGGRYLLVGPGWRGEPPKGATLLRAPTRMVWLIGRTQTNGVADYPLVHRLQDGLVLRTLSAWRAGSDDPPPAWQPAAERPASPVERMRAMGVEEFYTRLATLMVDNPPSGADAPMLAKLARIGVEPGRPPAWSLSERLAVALGRWVADRRLAAELSTPRGLVRGWSTPPASLGAYGADYGVRAAVAMVGLGANLAADATYPSARVDSEGRPLHGDHRYRLRFAADALPPVHAFWSVTAYGADDFLIDNPLGRHALGDRDPMLRAADGSLEILVQADPPEGEKRSNWLPVRRGEPFLLNARLYWPKPQALDGRWAMPAVERLD